MRDLIKKAVYSRLAPWLTRLARNQGVIIGLTYHRFEETTGADPRPGMSVTPAMLRLHLETLRELGPFISLRETLSPPAGPGIRFLLTFDDGYGDNAEVLPPILEEMKIPCCVYVVTQFVAGRLKALEHDARRGHCFSPLSVTALRTLAAHPLITIGSHSSSHRRLSELPASEIQKEAVESRQWLQEAIGREVFHFAAPFGQPSDVRWPETAGILLEAGYQSLASNFGGVNSTKEPEDLRHGDRRLVHVRRVPMPHSTEPWVIRAWTLGLSNLRERLTSHRRMPQNATL